MRLFNKLIICTSFIISVPSGLLSGQSPSYPLKAEGLLLGYVIGDVAGGPVEFVYPPERSFWSETYQPLTDDGIKELSSLFKIRAYPKDTEPYAQFEPYAPAGSVTDDTRWKMILINCLKEQDSLSEKNFAKSYWNFPHTIAAKYDSICALWQEEYGKI